MIHYIIAYYGTSKIETVYEARLSLPRKLICITELIAIVSAPALSTHQNYAIIMIRNNDYMIAIRVMYSETRLCETIMTITIT